VQKYLGWTLRSRAMEETWTSRDLPVLDAIAQLLDESPGGIFGSRVVERTGMDPADVERAVFALSPDYVILGRQLTEEGGIGTQYLDGVTAEARRVVGQWPTGESLVDQLAAGIEQAAEKVDDPEQKRRLLAVARELGGAAKAISINVASEILEHRLPH
jgi:hypothetical protein